MRVPAMSIENLISLIFKCVLSIAAAFCLKSLMFP